MVLLACPRKQAMADEVLEILSFCNIPLSLVICLLNTVVILHYYHHTSKLTSCMFLMISICDLSTALGHLVLSSSVVSFSGSSPEESYVSDWTAACLAMFHTFFGILGYALSIFFNLVMAVIRTIHICDPFYRLNANALKQAISCYVIFLLLLSILDVYYDVATVHTFKRPWLTIWFNVTLAFVGHNFVYNFNKVWLNEALPVWVQIGIVSTLVTIIFVIPVFVVILCLATQLKVVESRRNNSRRISELLPTWCARLLCCPRAGSSAENLSGDDLNSLTDWSHVNVTVFLLSLVFVICNSGIAALTIYFKYQVMFSKLKEGSVGDCYLQGVISTTLPLLSALLSPLIIISRSSTLRDDVRASLSAVWRAVIQCLSSVSQGTG